jgi:hypothetical protein
MGPKSRAQTAIQSLGAGDDKMNQIVAEVDRFFKTVHAEIEDWKFSMEDYGDGTRIFVRFQLHLNNSGAPPVRVGTPSESKVSVEGSGSGIPEATVRLPLPVGEPTVVLEPAHGAEAAGAAARADNDIAHFVAHWRQTRDKNSSREFHRDGAPYLDAGSSWNGEKRTHPEPTPKQPSRRRSGGAPTPPA